MSMYEQTLHINDTAFKPMTRDADRVLQKLLRNMVEKGSLEGSLTIKIDVEMNVEFVQNFDPNVEGETRQVLTPKLTHKVSSMMQIKDESKGETNYDGCEMVWDDELGEFVLKLITRTEQQSIFDEDYQVVDEDTALGGVKALLPPEAESDREDEHDEEDQNNGADELAEPADEDEEDEEDISDDFYGYDYEQPTEY